MRILTKYRSRVLVCLFGLLFLYPSPSLFAYQPNTLKINPLSPFIGNFVLNYERQLSKHYSIQAGVSFLFINILSQGISVRDTEGTARLVINGKGYMGSLRWYPLHISADNNEGLFFEVYGRYYAYTLTARRIILSSSQVNRLINNQTFTGKLQNYGIMTGYKFIPVKKGIFSPLSFEFEMGPGYNFISLEADKPGPQEVEIKPGFFNMFTSKTPNRSPGFRFALNIGWLF